jgi:hypothetical protein
MLFKAKEAKAWLMRQLSKSFKLSLRRKLKMLIKNRSNFIKQLKK